MGKDSIKLIANNKKAYHDYFIEDTYEAGVALHGTEVKSLRMGKCSIKESFVRIEKGEVIVYGMHISPYEKGNIFNKDPLRPKKLLMHREDRGKRVYAGAPAGLFQRQSGESGDRPGPRQEALRQTAGYREKRYAPGGGKRVQGAESVLNT